jgi:hypothetical protein
MEAHQRNSHNASSLNAPLLTLLIQTNQLGGGGSVLPQDAAARGQEEDVAKLDVEAQNITKELHNIKTTMTSTEKQTIQLIMLDAVGVNATGIQEEWII